MTRPLFQTLQAWCGVCSVCPALPGLARADTLASWRETIPGPAASDPGKPDSSIQAARAPSNRQRQTVAVVEENPTSGFKSSDPSKPCFADSSDALGQTRWSVTRRPRSRHMQNWRRPSIGGRPWGSPGLLAPVPWAITASGPTRCPEPWVGRILTGALGCLSRSATYSNQCARSEVNEPT